MHPIASKTGNKRAMDSSLLGFCEMSVQWDWRKHCANAIGGREARLSWWVDSCSINLPNKKFC